MIGLGVGNCTSDRLGTLWALGMALVALTTAVTVSLPIIPTQESINEGESMTTSKSLTPQDIHRWIAYAEFKEVLIVGGGVSGLSALNYLLEKKVNSAILLEAQTKLGGRVSTYREGSAILEEGAEWIHGVNRNIVYRIARKLKALAPPIDDARWGHLIVREDGSRKEIDEETAVLLEDLYLEGMRSTTVLKPFLQKSYGDFFIDGFNQDIADEGNRTDAENGWYHYLEQRVNSDEGVWNWTDFSATDANNYKDLGLDNSWKNGYDTLINYLKSSVTEQHLVTDSPVRRIFWDLEPASNKTLVVTSEGKSYLVDYVIVTVSVGYLKKNHGELFVPTLPRAHLQALEGIELGGPNKVILGWQKQWWGKKLMDMQIVWSKFNLPKGMEWMYGITNIFSSYTQSNVIIIFVSGNYSKEMENRQEEVVKQQVMFLLRRLFEPKNVTIPHPTIFRRTKWNSNPWTCGSYASYITMKGFNNGLVNREQYRQPVQSKQGDKKVWFAGEHTHDTRYGTVDGAMTSGIKQAKQVMTVIKEKLIAQNTNN